MLRGPKGEKRHIERGVGLASKRRYDSNMIWINDRLNALQMRLFAAAMGFYVLVLTVQVYPFAYYMGAAEFFGLLAIPFRVVIASIELADSLTGGKFPGTRP